jgi:hypothetical protein
VACRSGPQNAIWCASNQPLRSNCAAALVLPLPSSPPPRPSCVCCAPRRPSFLPLNVSENMGIQVQVHGAGLHTACARKGPQHVPRRIRAVDPQQCAERCGIRTLSHGRPQADGGRPRALLRQAGHCVSSLRGGGACFVFVPRAACAHTCMRLGESRVSLIGTPACTHAHIPRVQAACVPAPPGIGR